MTHQIWRLIKCDWRYSLDTITSSQAHIWTSPPSMIAAMTSIETNTFLEMNEYVNERVNWWGGGTYDKYSHDYWTTFRICFLQLLVNKVDFTLTRLALIFRHGKVDDRMAISCYTIHLYFIILPAHNTEHLNNISDSLQVPCIKWAPAVICGGYAVI